MNDELVKFIGSVIRASAKMCNISEEEIRAHSRLSDIVMARYLVFKIIKDKTRHMLTPSGRPVVTTATIGKLVGNFSHSVVVHGLKLAFVRLGGDPKIPADPIWVMTYDAIMTALIDDEMSPATYGSFFSYNAESYAQAKNFLYDLGEYELMEGRRDRVIYNANKILNKYRTC